MATSESDDFESADEGEESKSRAGKRSGDHKIETRTDNVQTGATEVLQTEHAEAKKSLTSKEQTDVSSGNKTAKAESTGNENEKSEAVIQASKSVADVKKPKSRPEREKRQPKPKDGKLGAVRLGTKITDATGTTDKSLVGEGGDGDVEGTAKDDEIAKDKIKEDAVKKVSSEEIQCEKTVFEEKTEHEKASTIESDISSVFDKLSTSEENSEKQSGGWGWGSWGTSLLSTATSSVSTFKTQVSQGLNTVLETVETGLGAPDPEELAHQEKMKEQLLKEEELKNEAPEINPEKATSDPDKEKNEDVDGNEQLPEGREQSQESGKQPSLFGIGSSWVSGMTKMVESTSSKVISGGLGTLEVIGRKTMEVLQEGDPGLMKKRALFTGPKPDLSQVLRDARDKAETEAKEQKEKEEERKAHFETLFDDYRGLVHLEALEMLSKQCEMKVQSRLLQESGVHLQEMQTLLDAVKDRCEVPDVEVEGDESLQQKDFAPAITEAVEKIGVTVSPQKMITCWESANEWLRIEESAKSQSPKEVHQRAIAALAELTALSMEMFHKTAELLMVQSRGDIEKQADELVALTTLLCSQLGVLSTRFSEHLNSLAGESHEAETVNSLITSVFLEASNSSTYIQDAFQLVVPILQRLTIQNSEE